MLSRKILIPAVLGHRHIVTTYCLQKTVGLNKQVQIMKKIMTGKRGGKKWKWNEGAPKMESVKRFSDTQGQSKETIRRVSVLNKLFMKNITDLMATDAFSKNILGYGIQVTVLKVSPDFQSINVFWLAKADEHDEEVDKILKSMAGPLRHELSQLRLMGEVPRIYFLKDKQYSKAAEVDVMLNKADFGEDFVPTDPTLFLKSTVPELQMKLSEHLKLKIHEIEQNLTEDEDAEEEELPEMRHDVMGLDHHAIMKRIATSIDKSKKAWETFGTRGESVMSTSTPTRDFTAAQLEIEKFSHEAALREDFVKFLERKQFERKATPERKKYKNLSPKYEEDETWDTRDQIPDDDFIEEDVDLKK